MKIRHLIGAAVIVSGVTFGAVRHHQQIYPPTYGVANPFVTQLNIQSTICKAGWTKTIRPSTSYTNKIKAEQLSDEDDLDMGDFEEDHIISLQLGGHPTAPGNLWAQPYEVTLNKVKMGARQKDVVETHLKRQVCAGKMDLKDAQYQIGHDWVKVYLQIVKP